MVTQIVLGRVYDFSRVLGRSGVTGEGFYLPIKAAIGEGDVVYVLNRGFELVPNVPWNRTGSATRVTKITLGTVPGDEEFIDEFLEYGDADGELIWPAGMALDSQDNIYITDEWMNRVSICDKDGNFVKTWGTAGIGDGEFNRPSGIAIDLQGDLVIADGLNHRVQTFTRDGAFLRKWGQFGRGDGEFDFPWGICLDREGYVYVADYRNSRVQKCTPDGEFVAKFGSYGNGRGQLNRPSDVTVDADGDVYVCDWGNNRVQVFAPDGRFMTSFIGDAQELSKWGKMGVAANPDVGKRRREVKTLEPEWRFEVPTGVTFDPEKNRLLVCDTQRQRIQIYNKVTDYVEPQRNL